MVVIPGLGSHLLHHSLLKLAKTPPRLHAHLVWVEGEVQDPAELVNDDNDDFNDYNDDNDTWPSTCC